jgi:hypothetical protein
MIGSNNLTWCFESIVDLSIVGRRGKYDVYITPFYYTS